MTDRIGGFGIQTGLQTGFGQGGMQATPEQAKGSHQGEKVTASQDALSMLEDAKEEMGMGQAEFRNKRELGERRLKGAEPSSQLETVKRIQEYLDQLPDIDPRKLKDMLEDLQRSGEKPSREALQRRLGAFHEDLTYQQTALEVMAAELERTGEQGELLDTVHGLLAENERAFGAEILAGRVVSRAALGGAGDAAEVQDLRQRYREMVLGPDLTNQQSAGAFYKQMVAEHGDGLGERLSSLLRAAGDDLHARGPSVDKAELQLITSEIGRLVAVATVRERAVASLERLDGRFRPF